MKNIIFSLAIVLVFSLTFVSSVGEVSYCAERTVDGAWCQNVPQDQVDDSYRSAPTSCEATSFCRLGTCIDSQEGTCLENTPQKVCEDNDGVWKEGEPEEIAQCQLGCCLVGDQAAFVTQTRCKRLSSLYSLEIDFRTDFSSELSCIASATSDVKGACVFEREFERTCDFVSKRECSEMETSGVDTEFHEGFLCSSESLATNCGPTEETVCVDGRDEVFFVDSCGNTANVYDAKKIKDKGYWSEVVELSESCNPESGNADSATCGSCDYFLGSTCKEFKRGEDKVKPNFGDNICRDLSCDYDNKDYQHGETWCADSEGIDKGLPGSRSFRMVCYDGDVSVEPCADFRQESCIQSELNGFSTAACRVNMWQDCTSQENKRDCENIDRRDCKWLSDVEFDNGNSCVPNLAPGLDFWEIESDTESICSIANKECIVTYEKKLGQDRICVDGCECLASSWESDMNNACVALGDCGGSANYIGKEGYHKGYKIKTRDAEEGKDE